MSCIIRSRTKN